jgi:hypothetical protein
MIQDEMDKSTELPGSESPASSEERENSKQPSLSPPSPTEDEGTKSSKQSFAKGQYITLLLFHKLYITSLNGLCYVLLCVLCYTYCKKVHM